MDVSHGFLKSLISMIQEVSNQSFTEIVSGGASGIDASAKALTLDYCATDYMAKKLLGKYREFTANWIEHGKAAGPIRNRQMAEYADVLLLIWDGKSKGSANMKKEMQKLKKPIYEVILRTENI